MREVLACSCELILDGPSPRSATYGKDDLLPGARRERGTRIGADRFFARRLDEDLIYYSSQ